MKRNIKYTFLEYVTDVWSYVKPFKGMFFLGVFLRATSDIANLYPVYAFSHILSILSSGVSVSVMTEKLIPFFAIWGFCSLYHSVNHNLSKYFGNQVAEKAGLGIYRQTLRHIFRLDLGWQEKENSGNKLKRIDRGADGVQVSVRRIFNVIIEVIVNFAGIIVIFLNINPALSFTLTVYVIVYFILGTWLLKRAIRQERVVNKAFENLGGLTFESLNNIQTIKSLAIDESVFRLITGLIQPLIGKIKKRIYYYRMQYFILLTFESMFAFSMVAILTKGIIDGRFEPSFLILFMGFFSKVRTSASELTEVVQELSMAKVWISRAKNILMTSPVIENPELIKHQIEYPRDWKVFAVKNVIFSYKKQIALNDISFEVKRGEKVGIVGLSGAGKSTLFKLMLDLHENYKGKITFDEISVKKIKRKSYIDHVAVVLQDTELFDMSLAENIRIASVGKKDVDGKYLKNVIKMAHLEDVVATLPHGLNTVVGEKGIKLSGGQRQRVGIARALFRQPDILLLDEATSHLDAHSEREIQKALGEVIDQYTTIVIAHRLSTIMAMDKIVVLEKGKVVEIGSFAELVKQNGVFAKMWEEQKI